jgi:hypothetical protein
LWLLQGNAMQLLTIRNLEPKLGQTEVDELDAGVLSSCSEDSMRCTLCSASYRPLAMRQGLTPGLIHQPGAHEYDLERGLLVSSSRMQAKHFMYMLWPAVPGRSQGHRELDVAHTDQIDHSQATGGRHHVYT